MSDLFTLAQTILRTPSNPPGDRERLAAGYLELRAALVPLHESREAVIDVATQLVSDLNAALLKTNAALAGLLGEDADAPA